MSSSERRIPVDPEYRAGLYKSLATVPEHHRLRNYASRFSGQDCWEEFKSAANLVAEDHSYSYKRQVERYEERWKSFIEHRSRHHALCTPADAEEYGKHLLYERDLKHSTSADYWSCVERFYRWMFFHTEYPHRYNPFVMAAVQEQTSHELWMEAITQE